MAEATKSPVRKYSLINPSAITGGAKTKLSGNLVAKKELTELVHIKKILGSLLRLERDYFQMLGDRIISFARAEEKRKLQAEELAQETKKGGKNKKDKTLGIKDKIADDVVSLGKFFQGIIKWFVGYKLLEWASKPANAKKLGDFVNLFVKLFKFISKITEFGVGALMKTLELASMGVNAVFDTVSKLAEFLTFKWIGADGIHGFLNNITKITGLFSSIPGAIIHTMQFMTNLIPKFLQSVLSDAVLGSKDELTAQADDAAKPKDIATDTTTPQTEKKNGNIEKIAKTELAQAGKNVLGELLPDGAPEVARQTGRRSRSTPMAPSDNDLPKLAKGGIVTKPTTAIVGEAGPEAILPLEKLGSFGIDGLKTSTNKMIPKFMELMTLPFKIIGAGVVSLIVSSISKIPGLGQFIVPLINGIGQRFGLPPGLISTMTNFKEGVSSLMQSGMGNIAEIFGGNSNIIPIKKGDEFSPSADKSVRGLLGNILNALISKHEKPKGTTPDDKKPPATPPSAPSAPNLPAPSSPGSAPIASPEALKMPTSVPKMDSTSPLTMPSFLTEGKVPGFGIGDKIPALLEPGEYVLNKKAVEGIGGFKILDKINYEELPRFQGGGPIKNGTSILSKLGDGTRLANAPPHKCVTGVLETMEANNVPNPPNNAKESNHPRGLAVQLIKSYGWGSIPGLGKPSSLSGAYGNVGVNMMSLTEWRDAVKANKIPSGAIIFTSRHKDWTVNQSGGNDAAIAKQGGRKLWSGLWQRGVFDGVASVYGPESKNIIALTPGGQQIPYDGSSSSDDGSSGESSSGDTEEAPKPIDWSNIVKGLAETYMKLNSTADALPPPPSVEAKPKEQPKITAPRSASSTSLRKTQTENLTLNKRGRKVSSGNVITIGEPNRTISEVSTQPMSNALGGTTPPNPLINYPVAP